MVFPIPSYSFFNLLSQLVEVFLVHVEVLLGVDLELFLLFQYGVSALEGNEKKSHIRWSFSRQWLDFFNFYLVHHAFVLEVLV